MSTLIAVFWEKLEDYIVLGCKNSNKAYTQKYV